jgi:glycosyltransferase involved in cell wall biosynthesis
MLPDLDRTLIVLPAFNEEEAVAEVVHEVLGNLPGVHCLVVDDGSSDSTAEVASAAGAMVASMPFNLGVGGAMRLGFRYALEQGFENVVQIDADGQHDPADVAALLAHLESYDIVIGSRFAGRGDYDVHGPRKWAMSTMSRVLSRIAGARLSDTTSGFKANGPRAVRLFAKTFPAEYLGDTVEALVIAARAGCRITQVPVSMRPRAGGRPSHNPFSAAIYLARAFIALVVALTRPAVHLPERA